MTDYRANLEKRKAELLAFLKTAQAQIQQAIGELNKIEGKLEAHAELVGDGAGDFTGELSAGNGA
jgi:multidrug resistance efflux pump